MNLFITVFAVFKSLQYASPVLSQLELFLGFLEDVICLCVIVDQLSLVKAKKLPLLASKVTLFSHSVTGLLKIDFHSWI